MPRPATPIGQLTNREQDVARLLARGKTNPEIAEELGITFATAKWYVSQVIAKLDASSREDAALIWQAEHRLPTRLRRAVASLGAVSLAKRLAIGAGTVGAVAVAAVVLFALLGDDDGTPVGPGETPTKEPSPTATTAAVADLCADANLVNGFLVIGEGEAPPECTGLASSTPVPPIAPDGKRYELAVPPGPWRQETFEPSTMANGLRLDGVRYYNDETGELALATYRHIWVDLPGRVIAGTNPVAVDSLPGPSIVVERTGSTAAYWAEGNQTFGVEVFDRGGSNLSWQQAVGLLVFFDPIRSTARFWDPETRTSVERGRPAWLYPEDVTTGVPLIDEVVRLSVPRQQSLEALADTVLAPCRASPPPSARPGPSCPDGLPEGTEVEALLLGACPNRLGALDISNLEVLRIVADDIGTSHLYAVAEARDASFPEVRYIAVFGDGGRWTSFALTNTGVAGVAWSCDTPDFVAWARTVDSWLLPPLYPLPD